MRKFCKSTFVLGCLLLLAVSLPVEVCGQVILGPRFGVRIGPHTFGGHTESMYSLQEVPITTGWSGRMNAIAINPADKLEVLVTSESGGLFKSTNGGVHWIHIDDLPPQETRDVAYFPSDPRIVFVTAFDDFRMPSSGAGVWRLGPEGRWQQPPTSILPVGGRCGGRPTGSGIAFEPGTKRIYVATSCGILISDDGSGERWHLVDRPRPGGESDWSPAVFNSVVAVGAGKVVIAGPAGVWYSSNNGRTWTREDSRSLRLGEGQDSEQTVHGLSASPVSRDQAYLVAGNSGAHTLWYTTDAGRHWKQIEGASIGGDSCGGNPFIKVGFVPGRRDIDLYYGENCLLRKLRATRELGTTPSFRYTGSWTDFSQEHPDARDVALQDGVQLFLANDGGLEKWNEAESRFHPVGGGRHGLNAWQLMIVTGQKIRSTGEEHLYIGSQDNGMDATADFGLSWHNGGIEGAIIQLDRQVERVVDSRVFWADNGDGNVKVTGGALFAEPRMPWPNCPNTRKDPILVARGTYIQAGYREPVFEKWLTRNFGESWEGPLTLAHEGEDYFSAAGPTDNPVLYQPAFFSGGRVAFVKLSNALTATEFRLTTVEEPLMINFGGLGLNATMWIWYNPFALDPGDAERIHLIAPDSVLGE